MNGGGGGFPAAAASRVAAPSAATRRAAARLRGRSVIVFLESLRLAFSSLRANPAARRPDGSRHHDRHRVGGRPDGHRHRAPRNRWSRSSTPSGPTRSRCAAAASSRAEIRSPCSDLAAINKTPGVKRTVYTVDTNATVTYKRHQRRRPASAAPHPEIQGINHLEVEAGSFFSTFAFQHDLPVAVRRLHRGLGPEHGAEQGDRPEAAHRRAQLRHRRRPQGRPGGVGFSSSDDSVIVPLRLDRWAAWWPSIRTSPPSACRRSRAPSAPIRRPWTAPCGYSTTSQPAPRRTSRSSTPARSPRPSPPRRRRSPS